MKITTMREKHYIDIIPQLSYSWYGGGSTLYIGWLMWNLVIEF